MGRNAIPEGAELWYCLQCNVRITDPFGARCPECGGEIARDREQGAIRRSLSIHTKLNRYIEQTTLKFD